MGYSVVTTVLSAAASYDLTDLETVRDELQIDAADTSDDSWLTRAIRQVSSSVASYTERVFAPEVVQDAFDIEQDAYPYQTPGGFSQLGLTRWPALAVLSVTQTLSLGTTKTLNQDVDFRLDPATGSLLRLNPFSGVVTAWEALPVTVQYVAGYGAYLQEAHPVPGTPFKVTVAQSAAFSCDQAVRYASSGVALTRVAASPTQGQYAVAEGVYTFAAADAGQSLTFAYATLAAPDDLVEIALRLIVGRFKGRGRDPALIQQDTPGVGTQRWWFGGAPGQTGQFPPDIAAALDGYRVPVVA